nr:unnamed protein product [Meloidogyne enterolobii]
MSIHEPCSYHHHHVHHEPCSRTTRYYKNMVRGKQEEKIPSLI